MSHKHHNCSCKHESVKYCERCRIVHCTDCNMEWGPRINSSFPQWYSNKLHNDGLQMFKNAYEESREQK